VAIASMTGFARAEGGDGGCTWHWEARSVNARGLDVRLRLPTGFEGLDGPCRERVSKRLKRGNVALSLTVAWSAGEAEVRVNTAVLEQILAAVPTIRSRVPDAVPPSIDGLLALRGVLEFADTTIAAEEREALERSVLAGLDTTLEGLADARGAEGERMAAVLRQHLGRIAALCAEADDLAAMQPAAILDRLKAQIADLLTAGLDLPEDRLVQEAALLVTKADPREELDRLKAHVSAATALLDESGPVGRRLDFLCQEFNREANTLSAKAADMALKRIGLDLKAVIDQLREQVQNIE